MQNSIHANLGYLTKLQFVQHCRYLGSSFVLCF